MSSRRFAKSLIQPSMGRGAWGCDGGILLNDTGNTAERTAPPNVNSVRGFDVIADAKRNVDDLCGAQQFSCADILVIAARDSVVKLGGSSYEVTLGRQDARQAARTEAEVTAQLPSPFENITELISKFQVKNFTLTELVALSGAHTVGQAQCFNFRNRSCDGVQIDPSFASNLQQSCSCPATSQTQPDDSNLSPIDVLTPGEFDNNYFNNLIALRGLFRSDQELMNNGTTAGIVRAYGNDSGAFLDDFAAAMIKMGNLPPLSDAELEIRDDCFSVNPLGPAAAPAAVQAF